MNNDLEQFSEERLKELASTPEKYDHRYTCNMLNGDESRALARIALSVKQAKPMAQVYQPANIGICAALGPAIRMINVGLPAGTLLYTTPQPAHTEQDGWIKCGEQMPQNNEQVLTWNGQYKATDLFLAGRFLCNKPKLITHWMPLPAAPKPDGEL